MVAPQCESCGYVNRPETDFCEGCGGALSRRRGPGPHVVDAPAPDVATGQWSVSETPFVGREAQTAMLARALAEAAGGSGRVAVLCGEPGIGKSRLVREFLRTRVDRHWNVLTMRASPQGRNIPYHPVAKMLRAWTGIEERDFQSDIAAKVRAHAERFVDHVDRFLPAVHELLDLPVQDAGWARVEPLRRRERMISAANGLMLSPAASPTVVVVEDAHWADSETLAVLEAVVDSLTGVKLLLIVTCRADWTPRWSGRQCCIACPLAPLAAMEAERLLLEQLGADSGLDDLRRRLIETSEGVPLHLEESVRALVATGALIGEPGRRCLAEHAAGMEIPTTAEDALALRIDRLPSVARRVLNVAAAVGTEVRRAVLAPTAGLADAELNRALGMLESAGLLSVAPAGPEIELVFPHAVIHETVIRTLPADERRAAMSGAIEVIETRWFNRLDEHVEQLARYALGAECWDKAVIYCQRAGEKALNRAAVNEGITHLEAAQAALTRLPNNRKTTEQAINLHLALPAAYRALGRVDKMLEHLGAAEALATALGDRPRLATVKVYEANVHNMQGRFDDAVAAGRRALELAESVGDPAIMGGAYSALGQAYLFQCNNRQVIRVFSRFLDFVGDKADPDQIRKTDATAVFCLAHLAAARALLGDFDEAELRIEDACRIADTIDHSHARELAHGVAGVTAVIRGDVEAAVSRLTRALEINDESNDHRLYPLIAGHLGYAYALGGRVDDALRLLETVVAQAQREKSPYDEAWSRAFLGFACLLAYDAEGATKHGEAALHFARERNFRAVEAWVLRLLGTERSIAVPSDPARSEAYLREALALTETLEMLPDVAHCRLALGQLFQRDGRFADARRETDAAVRLYRELGMTFWLPQAEAVLAEDAEGVSR